MRHGRGPYPAGVQYIREWSRVFHLGCSSTNRGRPSWIKSDRYTISAKAEGYVKPGVMNGPMLQTLLEDRFKLKIHRETRTVPEYALTIAKNGPKLERFSEESCTPIDRDRSSPVPVPPSQKPLCKSLIRMKGANLAMIEMQAATLDEFSKALGRILERPVADKTGITGMFDVRLEYAFNDASRGFLPPDSPAPLIPDDFSGPSIFTAVEEQLGLKLDSTKGPMECSAASSGGGTDSRCRTRSAMSFLESNSIEGKSGNGFPPSPPVKARSKAAECS